MCAWLLTEEMSQRMHAEFHVCTVSLKLKNYASVSMLI